MQIKIPSTIQMLQNIQEKPDPVILLESEGITLDHPVVQWIFQKHEETNHRYGDGKKLPYSFHLLMAIKVFKRFSHLIKNENLKIAIFWAILCHDLIEDARITYNDLKKVFGVFIADLVFAVSTNKGKNRKERADAKYYAEIVALEGAIFVKLCDRIANVSYSRNISLEGNMFECYLKENKNFLESLGFSQFKDHPYYLLFQELRTQFEFAGIPAKE